MTRQPPPRYDPHDRVRLQHLLDALSSAIRFVHERQRSDLDTDEMLLFALTRVIEIAGEAASKTSAEPRHAIPDVRWSAIIGMRNRLVHAYFDVDRDILWTTAAVAAAPVAEKLRALLDRL